MIFYSEALSTYCAKVAVVLRHKQIEISTRPPPGGHGSDAYKQIVPIGSIPAIVDSNWVLSESEAIVEYLNEAYPAPPMLPDDPRARAQVRAWSRMHDCWLEPELRAFYPYAGSIAQNAELISTRIERFHMRLAQFASTVAPILENGVNFLGGEDLSLADCAWPTTLIQAELLFEACGHQLLMPEPLVPWRQRLNSHPSVAPSLDACRVSMQQWMQSKGLAAEA